MQTCKDTTSQSSNSTLTEYFFPRMQLTLMIAHPNKKKKPMFYFYTAKTGSMSFTSLEVEFLNSYAASKINQN